VTGRDAFQVFCGVALLTSVAVFSARSIPSARAAWTTPYPYATADGPAAPLQVRAYARIATQIPACGVRNANWGGAIFKILNASIPQGRSDLRQALTDGVDDASSQLSFGSRDEYCHHFIGPDHWERLGDALIAGRRTVWNGDMAGATHSGSPP
jgi:hypothetical protein